MKKISLKKNYRVEIPGQHPVIVRTTTTIQHAVKHACLVSELQVASQLQLVIRVVDQRTEVEIFSVPAIDAAHAIKAKNKRDRQYAKLARQAQK